MNSLSRLKFALLTAPFLLIGEVSGQTQLETPQPSPGARVVQSIGVAEVVIDYHRPAVRGRRIWGSLVPYGEVWRAGANENTTISFSHPVKIEGQNLSAGTYGLHVIPRENEWTVIFSTNSRSWGSFFYREDEDALRVTVTPQEAAFAENLLYEFEDLTDSTATFSLLWEKLRVPVQVSMNMHQIVLQNIRERYLRGLAGFGWQGYNQAAQYCLTHNLNLEEALTWADRSIAINENASNLWTKADLLQKAGNVAESQTLRERALGIATEVELNAIGYQYLLSGRVDEAIEAFEANVRMFPDSWNVYDSLAEGLARRGDTQGAVRNFGRALELVQNETQKERIRRTINRLNEGL
ncbi:MAG: DUF2911 domain-containing protein [Bacteroidota bacterium]